MRSFEIPFTFKRINLANSACHWRGWFTGLSDMFLSSPPVKMLLLAGMDRLDTALTVGQMQGKFQLSCMPQSGHAIHEDQPLKGNFSMLIVL